MKTVGTISRGIIAPIIKKGDDLVKIVVDSVIEASVSEKFSLHDRDVVGVTEAVLGRSQGNYATLEQIAEDVHGKFPSGTVGLIFPILSRNRFSLLLKGISMGVEKLVIQLSYPQDEVGNPLIDLSRLDEKGIDPYTDCFTENEFKSIFGTVTHPFTGMDYMAYFRETAVCPCEIILANNPREILKYTDQVIAADIHTNRRTKTLLNKAGAKKVYGLDEILTQSVSGSGFQPDYGLLGSNLATDTSVKLFPRDAQLFVDKLQAEFKKRTGKTIECMIYGDGAFKDPIGGIWELADPVVSPGFTTGLNGQPNEIKLKYLADNKIGNLSGQAAVEAMRELIKHKDNNNQKTSQVSLGTTPRRLTDLLGSLCDLTSGSGDKGTPIILIQGYFDNFASEN